MTSNHHAPYDLGYTRATMDRAEGSEAARWSETHKTVLSSDCSLQLDCTKMESLVIANQHVAVNTFSGLVIFALDFFDSFLAHCSIVKDVEVLISVPI